MHFRLLGPVEVYNQQGVSLAVPPRERTLLAALLLDRGHTTSHTRLIDTLWNASPPPTARDQLYTCIHRLRRLLHQARIGTIATVAATYRIEIDPDSVDLLRFERLIEQAGTARAEQRWDDAITSFQQAEALWRGPALEGIESTRLRGMAAELDEKRLNATEHRLDLQLRHEPQQDVVPELTGLVHRHRFRERPHATLIQALHRAGRTAEAVAVYQQLRAGLADELGLDPSAALRELYQSLLRDPPAASAPADPADPADPPDPVDPAGQAPPATPPPATPDRRHVPAQLPADTAAFTGRQEHLARLDQLLDTPTAVVTVIGGTAGVGKTALAVHWAHRVAHRFPDGQLFVNLRGFAPGQEPMTAAEAVRDLLDALQVPPHRMPTTVEAQAGLYRSLLAGRRMLVVLDNARNADQVRPLLPGSAGCLALVTSRRQLSSLAATPGAQLLSLDLLPVEQARALLAGRLGHDRLAHEPDAVAEIIQPCAGLPLALTIIAARAAARPTLPLRLLASALRDRRGGLDALTTGDAATDARAVFSYSYHALDAPAARMFRLLGLHPGPDLGTGAAASLAGVALHQTRTLLGELTAAHLVTEPVPGRYALHDLLRAYAAELATNIDPQPALRAARRRMLDHYLHTAHAAHVQTDTFYPVAPPVAQPGSAPEDITSREQALAWFTAEQQVLRAVVTEAARAGFSTHSWQLAWAMGPWSGARLRDRVAAGLAALQASRAADDRTGQASSHRLIGRAYVLLNEHEQAQPHLLAALEQFEELGDHIGQALTHSDLGQSCAGQERYHEALRHVELQADRFRAAGNRRGEAGAINNVGVIHGLMGDHRQALEWSERAIAAHQDVGDRQGEAHPWDTSGSAHHHLGNHRAAIACYQRSLRLFREGGDRRVAVADVLDHLGDAYHALDDDRAARDVWHQAITILEWLDHPAADAIRGKLDQPPETVADTAAER